MPAGIFENGHFRSSIAGSISGVDPGASLRVLLALLAGAFMSVYLAPLRAKRPLIVGWFLASAAVLFGSLPVAGLLAAHCGIYLVFHPAGPRATWVAAGGAALATGLLTIGGGKSGLGPVVGLAFSVAIGAAAFWLHGHWLQGFLLRPRVGRALRFIAMHLPLVALLLGTFAGVLAAAPKIAPLALILLFWHYIRLLMYGIDVEDGLVPEDQTLPIYLSVFMSPATLNVYPEGISIAQGYSYQTDRFLSREKNDLVLRGLGIMAIALVYMALGPLLVASLVELAAGLGVKAYARITELLQLHLVARDAAPSTVLVTSLFDHLSWIFTLGGLLHFKVALWRLFGYDVDPYLRFPLLATNLVTLWTRLTYHWKEALVRGFYYPVFLRLSRWPFWARSLVATVAAAGLANWLWAHTTELLIWNGMTTESLEVSLRMWPYFVFLAGGIGIAQVWVTWRGRRRTPWRLDRWLVTDVVAAYVTTQFYALIHVFYYGQSVRIGSQADHWVMFLRAFGLA